MSYVCVLLLAMAGAAELGAAALNDTLALWVSGQGGRVERDAQGNIDSVDLTSAWITDADLARILRKRRD